MNVKEFIVLLTGYLVLAAAMVVGVVAFIASHGMLEPDPVTPAPTEIVEIPVPAGEWPDDRPLWRHSRVRLYDTRHDGHYFVLAVGEMVDYRDGYQQTGIGVSLVHHPDCPCFDSASEETE